MRGTKKLKRYIRKLMRLSIVTLLCFALIMMGGLFWIDNSWALIGDNDPTTKVELSLYTGGCLGDNSHTELDQDDNGVIPIAGGLLIYGNGDQDDNKNKAILIRTMAGAIVPLLPLRVVNSFTTHRLVAAYYDFGHLKVMPRGFSLFLGLNKTRLTCD